LIHFYKRFKRKLWRGGDGEEEVRKIKV